MEAFTLIVLGETMFGITKSPPSAENQTTFYSVVILGFLSLFLIKVYHFDVEEYHPEIHALGKSYWNKISWIYSNGKYFSNTLLKSMQIEDWKVLEWLWSGKTIFFIYMRSKVRLMEGKRDMVPLFQAFSERLQKLI